MDPAAPPVRGARRLLAPLLHPGAICAASALSVAVPLFGDAAWRTVSHHGFFHHAIVYGIFAHGVPPENPLVAGEPLRYYYGLHLALAAAMKVVPLSSDWLFALVNVLSIGAFVLVVDRVARYLDSERAVRAYACLLALTGLDPLTRGVLAAGAKSAGWPIERRALPWHKFVTVNAGQIGTLIDAVVLLLLVRVLHRQATRWEPVLFAGLTIVAAFVYPYAWMLIVVWVVVAAFAASIRGAPAGGTAAVVGATVVGSAIAVPYLHTLGQERPSLLHQVGGFTDFARHGAILLPAAAVAGIVCAVGARDLRAAWRRAPALAALLLAWGSMAIGTFLTLRLYDRTEYKFLLLGMTPLAVLLAPAARGTARARPWLAGALVVALLWPIGSKSAKALAWRSAEPAVRAGRYLRSARHEEAALDEWIVTSTPGDAVFIDGGRSIPVFARRPLFVALDESPSSLHAVSGAAALATERRRRLAESLLEEGTAPPPGIAARLRHEVAGRPVYVVARTPHARDRLLHSEDFERVYATRGAVVFVAR